MDNKDKNNEKKSYINFDALGPIIFGVLAVVLMALIAHYTGN